MIKKFTKITVPFAFILGIILLCSCNDFPLKEIQNVVDNAELGKMVKKDQEMRQNNTLDMEPIDKTHRLKVMGMLANGQLRTNKDKLNAALILQHTALTFCNEKLVSISPENYYLAYQLSKSVFDSGYKKNADMVAVTYDKYLPYTKSYQKYGIQRVFDQKNNEEYWSPIDSTTTDAERAMYMIKPIKELLKEYRMKPIDFNQ